MIVSETFLPSFDLTQVTSRNAKMVRTMAKLVSEMHTPCINWHDKACACFMFSWRFHCPRLPHEDEEGRRSLSARTSRDRV